MKRFLTICIVCLSIGSTMAQDPTFTQFYANPLYLNPAFAGSNNCPRFALNYRNQWPSLGNTFVTYSASYDQYFKAIQGGFGVMAMYDTQGDGTFKSSMAALMYSYHLKVNRKFSILFGARAAVMNKVLDWTKLTFGDQIDPRRGFIYTTNEVERGGQKLVPDASAGIIGYSKNIFFGFAAHHLNTPDESLIVGESPLPMRFTGHVGANIRLGGRSQYNNTTSIMPNIIYQYQNGFQELNIGTYLKYGTFTAGAWFRNRDAFILAIGINTGTFKVGYSYDVTVSKLGNGTTGGAHELSMGINVPCKSKPVKFRTISCPSF